MRIDIWSDIACPWCLIGKKRFDTAVEQLDFADQLEVVYHSFLLDPSLPDHVDGTEAEYLAEHKDLPPAQVRQMLEHVTQVAAGEGLAYDFDHLVVASSRKGHRLLHGARALDEAGQTAGLQARVKEAMLRGHFERGLDIGDDDQLVEMAAEAGMEPEAARAVLAEQVWDQAIQMDLSTAAAYQVSGVPFYVIDNAYGVAGAEQPEVFVQAITQAWQERDAQRHTGETAQ